MTLDAIGRRIPEFDDDGTEQAYRLWSMPETLRRARAVLWVAAVATLLLGLNDLRQFGAGLAASALISLRLCVAAWSMLLVWRLCRPVTAAAFDRHALAWAIGIELQSTIVSAVRPPDFPPNLLVVQTTVFGLMIFWPLRMRVRVWNAGSFALLCIALMTWTGALSMPLVVPFSMALALALALGTPLAMQIERLRRQEFARMRQEHTRMEELRLAKEAAEVADRAKTRFLAIVSHEVRTPMNGVLGVLQLLEGLPLGALQRRHVTTARDCAESLTGLLESILDYARLDTVMDKPVPVDFDPRQLIESVVDLMRPRAQAQRIDLTLDIAQPLPEVLNADAARLRQVLVNLLSNAIKFTEHGHVAVTAGVRPFGTGGQRLELEVEDTGIGIPAPMLDRIFDEFTQADDSIARRFGGAGLGLAVCRRIVERMGGVIGVESHSGAGSRFRFSVPVEAGRVLHVQTLWAVPTKRLEILVVDDDPINQIVACGLLAQLGHGATPAAGAEAGLTELAQARFDLVLMDLHMPGVDGFEATRRIRALPTPVQARVPVVAVTADLSMQGDARLAMLGFSGMLTKPVRRSALRSLLAGFDTAGTAPSGRSGAALAGDAPIDVAHLAEQVGALGIQVVAGLFRMFRQVGRDTMAEIAAAVANSDPRRAAALAHRLGSSAATLGFGRLHALAQRVEAAAAQGELRQFSICAGELPAEFSQAFAALRELVRDARRPRLGPGPQSSPVTLASSR